MCIAGTLHALKCSSNSFTSIEDKMRFPVIDKIIVADLIGNGKNFKKEQQTQKPT
jgi:hypothetical protein